MLVAQHRRWSSHGSCGCVWCGLGRGKAGQIRASKPAQSPTGASPPLFPAHPPPSIPLQKLTTILSFQELSVSQGSHLAVWNCPPIASMVSSGILIGKHLQPFDQTLRLCCSSGQLWFFTRVQGGPTASPQSISR